jgi:hypothetical protein
LVVVLVRHVGGGHQLDLIAVAVLEVRSVVVRAAGVGMPVLEEQRPPVRGCGVDERVDVGPRTGRSTTATLRTWLCSVSGCLARRRARRSSAWRAPASRWTA